MSPHGSGGTLTGTTPLAYSLGGMFVQGLRVDPVTGVLDGTGSFVAVTWLGCSGMLRCCRLRCAAVAARAAACFVVCLLARGLESGGFFVVFLSARCLGSLFAGVPCCSPCVKMHALAAGVITARPGLYAVTVQIANVVTTQNYNINLRVLAAKVTAFGFPPVAQLFGLNGYARSTHSHARMLGFWTVMRVCRPFAL
jgi:hypothetical protein